MTLCYTPLQGHRGSVPQWPPLFLWWQVLFLASSFCGRIHIRGNEVRWLCFLTEIKYITPNLRFSVRYFFCGNAFNYGALSRTSFNRDGSHSKNDAPGATGGELFQSNTEDGNDELHFETSDTAHGW